MDNGRSDVSKTAHRVQRTTDTAMFYEVAQVDGEWRVEAVDHKSEGECYVTLFPGLYGERRAHEYASFKNYS